MTDKNKADFGKAQLTLVPRRIIWDIARVRIYGVNVKYPETGRDGWREIGRERLQDALLRHVLRYLDDPDGVDDESGASALVACGCKCGFFVRVGGGKVMIQIGIVDTIKALSEGCYQDLAKKYGCTPTEIAIAAFDRSIKVLRFAIPKAPDMCREADGKVHAYCPSCETDISDLDDSWDFCPYCGQAIRMTEEKE